jgi:hypothetical protein
MRPEKSDSPILTVLEQNKERDNTKKSEAQKCLRHGKEGKNIKEPKQRRLEPKSKVVKTRCSDFGSPVVQFLLNR